MMSEIVHYSHTATHAAHFHAALDAFESVERRLNLGVLQAAVLGAADHGQRIANIQFTKEIQSNLKLGISNSEAVGARFRLNARTAFSGPRPKRFTGQ